MVSFKSLNDVYIYIVLYIYKVFYIYIVLPVVILFISHMLSSACLTNKTIFWKNNLDLTLFILMNLIATYIGAYSIVFLK